MTKEEQHLWDLLREARAIFPDAIEEKERFIRENPHHEDYDEVLRDLNEDRNFYALIEANWPNWNDRSDTTAQLNSDK